MGKVNEHRKGMKKEFIKQERRGRKTKPPDKRGAWWGLVNPAAPPGEAGFIFYFLKKTEQRYVYYYN